MKRLLLLLTIATQTAGAQQRLPFQKKEITLKSPENYERRVLRADSKTGEPVYYDPKPRVVPLDVKSGKYGLRWIGYDGKEKTIIYQRPDAIDAVVSASASKAASGQYVYTYTIKNLPSSGQNLSGFAVQTFASDARLTAVNERIHFGHMSSNKEMNSGKWVRFGILPEFDPAISPGRSIELELTSSAPPGLVECRIHGGRLGMKGVGEHPPEELESVLPGYAAWPSSYTLGPVDDLKQLSSSEKVDYLLKSLPRFRQQGWMTASLVRWYEQNLQRGNLGQVLKRADQDLKSGAITTEVHSIVQAMQP